MRAIGGGLGSKRRRCAPPVGSPEFGARMSTGLWHWAGIRLSSWTRDALPALCDPVAAGLPESTSAGSSPSTQEDVRGQDRLQRGQHPRMCLQARWTCWRTSIALTPPIAWPSPPRIWPPRSQRPRRRAAAVRYGLAACTTLQREPRDTTPRVPHFRWPALCSRAPGSSYNYCG